MGNPRLKDISGQNFGSWHVTSKHGNTQRGMALWRCTCICGTEGIVSGADLRGNKSKSCGCLSWKSRVKKKEKDSRYHGQSKTRLYNIWMLMRSRCRDISNESYGAKGISVCEEWHSFKTFMDWAVSSGYDETLTIDRIDCDDGYHPINCRWADSETQSSNRNYTHKAPDGELYWHKARANGVTRAAYEWRKAKGWSWDMIVNHPPNKRRNGFNRDEFGKFTVIEDD